MPAVRSAPNDLGVCSQRADGLPGLPISLRDLLERQVLEFLFGHEAFQLVVLVAEPFRFLGLIEIHVPVTGPPVIEGRRGDPELASELVARRALGGHSMRCLEFANDLFRRIPRLRRLVMMMLSLPAIRTPTLRGTKFRVHSNATAARDFQICGLCRRAQPGLGTWIGRQFGLYPKLSNKVEVASEIGCSSETPG